MEYIMQKPGVFTDIPRPKREKRLPVVLSQQEVKRILSVLENKKHRALLFVIYSAGLRVSEAASLKVQDIDSDRMMIHICQGKGKRIDIPYYQNQHWKNCGYMQKPII